MRCIVHAFIQIVLFETGEKNLQYRIIQDISIMT